MNTRARILVVEDDPHLRLATSRILKHAGYELFEAETGRDGLRLAKELRPDLILLDVVLPDIDGHEVCQSMKADPASAECFILMLSSMKTSSDEQAAGLENGADGYIARPIPNRELLARVKAMLRLKSAEDRAEKLNHSLCAIGKELMVRQRDRAHLIQNACELLSVSRNYQAVWIALFDDGAKLTANAESGLGKVFPPFVERLERGELSSCARKALAQEGVLVIIDPSSDCEGCSLKTTYADRGSLTIRLVYENTVYGILCASTSLQIVSSDAEQMAFRDIAGHIAFGLYNIELREERNRMEESLQQSLARWESLVENTSDFIAIIDRNGIIQYINHVYPGFRHEKVLGTSNYDYIDPQYYEMVRQGMQQVFDTRQAVSYELQGVGPNGTTTWYETRLSPLLLGDEVAYVTQLSFDISDRKEAEKILQAYSERLEEMVDARSRELRDTQEKLLRQERLAALGQLAGGVGHELRTPLATILNAIYYLKMVLPEARADVAEYLDIIDAQTKNAKKIINDLLDFARMESLKKEAIAASTLIELALNQISVPDRIALVRDLPEDLPDMHVDRRHLEQVLLNLLKNACDAMPEGGTLTVTSKQLSVSSTENSHGLLNTDNRLLIIVQDTGCGISEEHLSKLFEPLFTTKSSGIGLGLAISKNLIEANGGEISVESTEGEGSSFTLSLPIQASVLGE